MLHLNKINIISLKVNPPTAYRMLNDFIKMESDDIVVQNGANSAVGRYVIQVIFFLIFFNSF